VAGSYVINAKLNVWNADVYATPEGECKLTAGGDYDRLRFAVGDADTSVVEDKRTTVNTATTTGGKP
jgi:hypothetical protein